MKVQILRYRTLINYLAIGLLGVSVLTFTSCDKKDKPEPPVEAVLKISSFTEHAKGGEIITISGTGFSTTPVNNIVKVNNVVATVTEATTSSLKVTVPVKAGTGPIEVSVGGKTATSTTHFTYDWVWMVSTLAGSGEPGFTNGNGTGARFNGPTSVAVDKEGNVYVADAFNHSIRKISPTGVVSTLAGNGTAADIDANGENARFNNPHGVAVDKEGNVYVADFNNHKIRKITNDRLVSTLAGAGVPGYTNGTGSSAKFNNPSGISVDTVQGAIYVADYSNHRIRVVSPDGTVSVLAGSTQGNVDGSKFTAKFSNPISLVIDAVTKNVYVADLNNHKVRTITTAVSTLAGNGTAGDANGNGTAAQFNLLAGVGLDATGTIYVADQNNHKIRKITATGSVTTIAGNGTVGKGNGSGDNVQFYKPYSVAVDKDGNLYIADFGNHLIRKITLQ